MSGLLTVQEDIASSNKQECKPRFSKDFCLVTLTPSAVEDAESLPGDKSQCGTMASSFRTLILPCL